MRNGQKIYDTDTHIAPTAETIRPYISALLLERVPDLEEHRRPVRMSVTREPLEPPYRHVYRFRGEDNDGFGFGAHRARFLGEANKCRADEPLQFVVAFQGQLDTGGADRRNQTLRNVGAIQIGQFDEADGCPAAPHAFFAADGGGVTLENVRGN